MSNAACLAARAIEGPSARRALATHAATTVAFLAASSVLTPLYRLYQEAWGFAPATLTLIFGLYPIGILVSLIVGGALSDHLGRRTVLHVALALEIVAMAHFLGATSSAWLLAGRLLQGIATGLATSTLAAALIDLDNRRGALINSVAPMIGMALGALGATVLVELAPAPLHLVFVVLLAVFAGQLVLTWRAPETAPRRRGAWKSLRPVLSVPRRARAELLAVTPLNVAVWALGGFYLSLMPSLAAAVTGSDTVWLGGLSVAALTLSGGFAIAILRKREPMTARIGGAIALIAGMAVILVGADTGEGGVLLAGSVIAGFGFGAGFLGAMRSVAPLAAPHERAGLMVVFYVECYLANSLPAILAGTMVQRLDLLTVANIYGAALIVLAAGGLLLTRRRRPLAAH